MDYVTNYYKNLSEQLQHRVNNLNKKLKYLRENGPIISDGNQGQGQGSITAIRPVFGPGGYFTPFWPESQEPTVSPRPPWAIDRSNEKPITPLTDKERARNQEKFEQLAREMQDKADRLRQETPGANETEQEFIERMVRQYWRILDDLKRRIRGIGGYDVDVGPYDPLYSEENFRKYVRRYYRDWQRQNTY
jgi:hypothetical protein